MRDQLRVLRHTVIVAYQELLTIYTWRSWVFGWLLRLIFQVAFFTSVGYFVESPETVRFLVVGNAVMLVALEATIVILSSVHERQAGTLPILLASPAGFLAVFLGRGVHWILTGVTSSSITLFLLAPWFGVDISFGMALSILPMLPVIALAAYCYGTAIGAVVLHVMEIRFMVVNVSYMTLMAVTGVNVPVDFWPRGVQVVAQALPVTHGLQAVRLRLAGAPAVDILTQLGLELAVAAAWLCTAAAAYAYLGHRGRVNGSIEFSV